jgi:dTMP kinase
VSGLALGRLVAFEGIDGSGKSTQARRLAAALGADLTFEPGATELGSRLRSLLLDPEGPDPDVRSEALLMAADRSAHVEQIIAPALAAGRWVVSDRFSASTLAYQGFGRGLELVALQEVVAYATGGLRADLSVLVRLDPDVARWRLAGSAPDRLERLDPAFHRRVHEGYDTLSAADPEHWVVVDGTLPIDDLAAAIDERVQARLGRPGTSAP